MTRLIYSAPNAAWFFIFGDAPLRLENEELFFATRLGAIEAAQRHGLQVSRTGDVTTSEASNG